MNFVLVGVGVIYYLWLAWGWCGLLGLRVFRLGWFGRRCGLKLFGGFIDLGVFAGWWAGFLVFGVGLFW